MTKKLHKSSFQKRNLTLAFFLWISLFSFSQEVVWKGDKVYEKKIEELSKFYSKGNIPKALEISDYLFENVFEDCNPYYRGEILSTRAYLLRVGNPKECYNLALIYINLIKSNYDYYINVLESRTEVDKVISAIETETNKLVDENPSLGLAKIGSSAKSEISNSTASGVKKTDTKEVNIQKESKTIAPITEEKTQDNNVANNESEIKTKTEDQSKTITLVVTGSGNTKDEARNVGLRNAIELAYTSYVSSKTEILNDELVKDEIITVASGNIINYKLLKEDLLNNTYHNTMEVTVSVNKLISYAQGKGVTVEFSGSLFGAEMKQQKLNEEAESKAVENICFVFDQLLRNCFDYSVEVSEPILDKDAYSVNYKVTSTTNQTFYSAIEYLVSNLTAISMKLPEIEKYKKVQKVCYRAGLLGLETGTNVGYSNGINYRFGRVTTTTRTDEGYVEQNTKVRESGDFALINVEDYIYFRSEGSVISLMNLLIKANRYPYLFTVKSNISEVYPTVKSWKLDNNSFPHSLIGNHQQYGKVNVYSPSKYSFDLLFAQDSLTGNFLVTKEMYFSATVQEYKNYFNEKQKWSSKQNMEGTEKNQYQPKIPNISHFRNINHVEFCNNSFPKADENCFILDVLLLSKIKSYSYVSQYTSRYTLDEIEKISKIEIVPVNEE